MALKANAILSKWGPWILLVALIGVATWPALVNLAEVWVVNEAYSHGFIIIFIALFLGIQQLRRSTTDQAIPSAWFLPLILASLFIIVPASVSELHVLVHYGLFGFICSLVIGLLGWQGIRILFVPLTLLFLAIPIPGYFESNLTASLKLMSSELGSELLYLIGVPVFNDGNIIDLGTYRLQVADACAGLNYLFPLMAIGVILAGFLETATWRRVAIVVLTIPITVSMNILRIAVAGLLVRYFGPEAADGFIHDFQGWMVFVVSLLLLLPLTAVLLRIGVHPVSLRDALNIDYSILPIKISKPTDLRYRRNLNRAVVLSLAALVATVSLSDREKNQPQRSQFAVFPSSLGDWVGTRSSIDRETISMLKLTDYLFADYRAPKHKEAVELFASYYAVQTDGATPHSPEVCLPASGWEILTLERSSVALQSSITVPVNRALMQSGDDKMLVFYWFQQRGRLFANEFAMKWFIFQDAVFMNRTDGAFLRVTTPITSSIEEAEKRLTDFVEDIWPVLPSYIPPASEASAISLSYKTPPHHTTLMTQHGDS